MQKYYKGANGAVYRHIKTESTETHNIPKGLDTSTLIEITEEEYTVARAQLEQSKQQSAAQAKVVRAEAEKLRLAKKTAELVAAYWEIRNLGVSDAGARAVSGYYGPVT